MKNSKKDYGLTSSIKFHFKSPTISSWNHIRTFFIIFSDVYNLINFSELKLKKEKTYEIFEHTYSKIFRADLELFAKRVKSNLL